MPKQITVLYVCDGSDKEGMRRNFEADLHAIKAVTGGVGTSWNPADAYKHLVSGSWKFDAVVARSSAGGWSGGEFISDVNYKRAAKNLAMIPGYTMAAALPLAESHLEGFLKLTAENAVVPQA